MTFTQAELDILAQGGTVNFGLPTDPGLTSADGIYFENVNFQTATGDQSTTPQGETSLDVLNDVGNYGLTNTEFVVRNSVLTVGDDLGSTSGDNSILSFSGSGTQVTLTGGGSSSNSSTWLRLAAENGEDSSATAFINDGAQVTIDNTAGSLSRGIEVGVNFGPYSNGGQIVGGGQSIDASLVIEGAGTLVEVVNTQGNRGSLTIGQINDGDTGITDPTSNRSATGLAIIRDGAEVNIRQFIGIGDANNVDGATAGGSLLIEGQNTTVTVGDLSRTGDNGFMRIAEDGGSGALVMRDGAELTLLAGDVFGGGVQLSGGSTQNGGDATAIITGAGTRIVAEQGFIGVGQNGGTSSFTLSDGAAVDALFFTSGRSGSAETVVEGEGTELNLFGSQIVPEFGAFLTVGRDADGSFTLRDGADVTITGDGGEFPGFQAGRNDGGVGEITVTGQGSTITIDGAGNIETGEGETGYIRAGRSSGSDGTINVLDGGVIINETTGLLVVAEFEGSIGNVTVDGTGSTFDFGATALLSGNASAAGGDSHVTVSDGGLLRGGDVVNNGVITTTTGGTLEADQIFIGESGTIDFDGSVVGHVELHGHFEIAGNGVGSVVLDGDFLTEVVSTIAIDITNFSGGVGDSMTLTGIGNFDEGFLELEVANALSIADGETYALATSTTGVVLTTSIVVDPATGRAFEASQIGTSAVLTALAFDTVITPGSDILAGSQFGNTVDLLSGDDVYSGLGGNDTVEGGAGDDGIYLGAGADTAFGEGGNDLIRGGAASDDIFGGAGKDELFGDNGADEIEGGSGADLIFGGSGTDTLSGGNSSDIIDGGTGDDVINGEGFTDTLNGGDGDDTITGGGSSDTINGGADNDTLFGNNARDFINGGTGDDVLNGGRENDELRGGNGDDEIFGSTGDDSLYGDSGADTFQFRANHGEDRIFDFEDGTDIIEFDINSVTDISDLTLTNVFAGVDIDYGTGTIRVLGFDDTDFSNADFVFV